MRPLLILILLLLSSVEAVELPSGAQAAEDRFNEAVRAAREDFDQAFRKAAKRLVSDLEREMRDQTRAGNLDAALAVRDRLKRAEVAAAAEDVRVRSPRSRSSSGSAGRGAHCVTVDSRSPEGTRVGRFTQGQVLEFQYLQGTWNIWVGTWQPASPDTWPKIHGRAEVQVRGEGGTLLDQTVLPRGTAESPFRYTVPETGELWLRCSDNNYGDNAGSVEYRVSLSR